MRPTVSESVSCRKNVFMLKFSNFRAKDWVYNDLIPKKTEKKLTGVSYETILSVLCLSEIGMRILFTWVLRNLVLVIACSI